VKRGCNISLIMNQWGHLSRGIGPRQPGRQPRQLRWQRGWRWPRRRQWWWVGSDGSAPGNQYGRRMKALTKRIEIFIISHKTMENGGLFINTYIDTYVYMWVYYFFLPPFCLLERVFCSLWPFLVFVVVAGGSFPASLLLFHQRYKWIDQFFFVESLVLLMATDCWDGAVLVAVFVPFVCDGFDFVLVLICRLLRLLLPFVAETETGSSDWQFAGKVGQER